MGPGTKNILFYLNVTAFMLHLALAVVTGIIGNVGLRPPLYELKNTFTFNSSSSGFTIVPRLEEHGGFPVTTLTFSFFAITSWFHLANALWWRKWYFDSLEECFTPSRWTEYSITAPIMASIIAYLSGLRETFAIVTISGLILTTMLFGLFTELYNRPHSADEWGEENPLARLFPHFLGFVPYAFAWARILHSFFGTGGTCAAPAWVWAIIVGQFVLFSSFVFPQQYQILNSPHKFANGEVGFIVLSFVSKAMLGIILLFGGITQDTFDAFESIDVNTTCDVNNVA